MAKRTVEEASLTAIADAIRAKTGTSEPLEFPNGFAEAVESITANSGIDAVALINKTITEASDDTLIDIGNYGFNGCVSLDRVEFPKVSTVGNSAFSGCTNLSSVDMPNVTAFGSNAFQNCAALKSINFPLAKTLGNYAFSKCIALESINLPICETIGDYVFRYDTGLTDLFLPKAKAIGQYAFDGCTALKTIDLPAANSISKSSFSGCNSLGVVILRNTEKICSIINTSFYNTPFASGGTGGKVLVPSAFAESYKNATNWSTLYGYGTCTFLALEDYTVDGTTTGEIDWDKLNT